MATKLSSQCLGPIAGSFDMSCAYTLVQKVADELVLWACLPLTQPIALNYLFHKMKIRYLCYKRIHSTVALNNRLPMHLKYKPICTQLFRNKSIT